MLAILLGLFGSFWFAVSMVLINRGVLSVDYFRGLLTNLGVNALFLWIYVLIFTDRIDLWEPANLLFVMIGVFVPGIARYFIFKGMERLGASISSCLTNSTPLFATLDRGIISSRATQRDQSFGYVHHRLRNHLALLAWNGENLANAGSSVSSRGGFPVRGARQSRSDRRRPYSRANPRRIHRRNHLVCNHDAHVSGPRRKKNRLPNPPRAA